ncbi:type I polyketide synthase [Streptomyces sp. GC420]|uniref:type I polyketide synthase n=1 Tax=Streptomyces sp. GC420 TaxID=2697568 RepID=UPI001415111B|nr:type I polyketide synthase [Streptomyces sp. GC420]NBM18357.1 SDR family NAD(P)-dependent oxidoreductase [Streptomyces sp. GC420]
MNGAAGGQEDRPAPGTAQPPAGSPATGTPGAAELRSMLRGLVAELCGIPADGLDDERPLTEYGLTSRDAVELSGRLEEALDRSLPATLLWENPSVGQLVAALGPDAPREQEQRHDGEEEDGSGGRGECRETGRDAGAPAARGVAGAAGPASPADAVPIAVIGVGCRLPGGINGPEEFWRHLLAGTDAVGQVPERRWRDFDDGAPDTAAVLEHTTRWGGFLDDIEGFDADFFGITPREAEVMDPQQRLLLEVGWEALDHAGIAAPVLRGTATGVFVGLSALEYGHLTTADLSRVTAWTSTGAAGSIAANRLSYLLDLRGPSITVDTACSSSLVAVHQACRSLRGGECDTALAAGVNVLLSPAITANFDRADALAADGRCKPFDAAADGITRGEGCGVVVLKRLTDARRDGDRVLAVIRGTAVNSDGRSAGLMAPNPHAQEALLRSALSDAGVRGTDIDYVETHGTGTLLGDPIEAGALGAVLGSGRPAGRPLLIGSVKSNLGHLEGAAGIAGLIKTVLSLHHGQVPPSLHFRSPNPHIDFTGLRLRVVTEPAPWPESGRAAALAGVSAFGFGGTNAHAVLEQASPAPSPLSGAEAETGGSVPHVLLVTARSGERLGDAAGALARTLASGAGVGAPALADLAHTLARHGRGPVGAAVVARDRDELATRLAALARDESLPGIVPPRRHQAGPDGPAARRPVFVFSGYGSQWPGMGRRLLRDEPRFADAVAGLDTAFAAQTGSTLTEFLLGPDGGTGVDRTQPLLFGLQLALARTLCAYGVEPAAVIGHSMGEVSAAVLAGALDVRDGLRVVLERSAKLAAVDGERAGAMAAVELPEDAREAALGRHPGVGIAVHGSPRRCTVAGPAGPVRHMVDELTGEGCLARLLPVSGAGHSPAVEPVLPALREALESVRPRTATTPWYGTVLDDPRATVRPDADYWCANVRRPVRFQQAVEAAAADGHDLFVEISPHPVALVPLGETLEAVSAHRAVALPTVHRNSDEAVDLRTCLAALHLAGVEGPAGHLWPRGTRVALPTPPWRHERHWFPARRASRRTAAAGGHALLGLRVDDPRSGRVLWQGELGTDSANLAARTLHGRPVLTLPACAELVIAAAREVQGTQQVPFRINELTIHQWLPISARTSVTTVWEPSGGDHAEVTVHSRSPAGTWRCHASARVPTAPGSPGPGRLDAGSPEPRRPDADAPLAAVTHWSADAGEHEPGRRPLGQLLDAVLHAPVRPGDEGRGNGHEGEAADRGRATTRSAGHGAGAGAGGGAERVPVRVGSLWIDPAGTADGEYRIRFSPASHDDEPAASGDQGERWDIRANGAASPDRPGVVALDVRTRAAERGEVPHPLDSMTYEIQWEKTPVPVPRPPSHVLLLSDETEDARDRLTGALVAVLEEKGVRVTVGTSRGDAAGGRVDTWREKTRGERSAVVVLLAGDRSPSDADSDAGPGAVSGAVSPSCRGLTAAVQVARRLASGPRATVAPRLWLVTRRAQSVSPGETGEPDLACLRGLVRVLGLEQPELRTSLVDIDAQPGLVDDLVQELLADGDADEVAWRAGTRLVARLAAADPADRYEAIPFARPDGAYVVTGGLTGLGLATARRLAEQGAGRLVLNGRRAPGPRARSALAELEALGTSVSVVEGDVAEPGVATCLVETAGAEGHTLRGVAHAAGVLGDRMVTDLEPSDIEAVFRPKAQGALLLDEATAGHELDWWLVYSSAAALFGSPGQAAYAAANAWLDAAALRRRAVGLPATSIAWGPWAEVGAAPENPALALDPIAPSDGLDALQALVASGRVHTGVAHLDARRALEAYPGLEAVPFFAGVLLDGSLTADDWAGPEGIAALGEAAADKVYKRLVKRTAAVMGFAVHDLDETVPLTELGLDSLMTVRIRNAARQDFAVDLPAPLLLRGAGLREIGDAVLDELGLSRAEPGGVAEDGVAQNGVAPDRAGLDRPAATPPVQDGDGREDAVREGDRPGRRATGERTAPTLPDSIGPRDASERLVTGVWNEVLGRPVRLEEIPGA